MEDVRTEEYEKTVESGVVVNGQAYLFDLIITSICFNHFNIGSPKMSKMGNRNIFS